MARIVVNNERYPLILYEREENSPYVWKKEPSAWFRGRPASQNEIKQYRIQAGVNGNTDSVFVICSNLPKAVKPKDKIFFQGREWTVMSRGFYYDNARFINPGIMSDEYIASKCPKGLNLQ